MNIVLVNPPPQQVLEMHDKPEYPHLGLGYIAAFVKQQDADVSIAIIDAKFEEVDLREVERRLYQLKSDIVGVTAMTHEILQANKVAQIAKGISPATVVIIGGVHATALPKQTLEEFADFDILVFGEGEETFFEIITALENDRPLQWINGIGYRNGNNINLNEARKPLETLDKLPPPAWDLFPKSTTYPVITARGCPFNCNFCMRVLGGKLRKRTPQNVLEELQKDITTHNAHSIHFVDETFAIDKRYANELLDLMIESGIPKKVAIKWTTSSRYNWIGSTFGKKIPCWRWKFI